MIESAESLFDGWFGVVPGIWETTVNNVSQRLLGFRKSWSNLKVVSPVKSIEILAPIMSRHSQT